MTASDKPLREELAALCHEQWSGWMRYLFSKTNGRNFLILPEYIARLKRQMETPYEQLSDEEKESDRKEADRFLSILQASNEAMRLERDALAELCAKAFKAYHEYMRSPNKHGGENLDNLPDGDERFLEAMDALDTPPSVEAAKAIAEVVEAAKILAESLKPLPQAPLVFTCGEGIDCDAECSIKMDEAGASRLKKALSRLAEAEKHG